MHSINAAAEDEFVLRLEPVDDSSPAFPATLDEIADELNRLNRAVTELVARMDDEDADAEDLDTITERIVEVLARIEQLRCARAWSHAKARSDEHRWVDYLDVA